MIATRMAHGATENKDLREIRATGEGNQAWLARQSGTGVVLLGGASRSHFRIRTAQCDFRRDLLPSFWSAAGILVKPGIIATVPLEVIGHGDRLIRNNAVAEVPASQFDDPELFPNIALLQFPALSARLAADIESVKVDRSIIDIPSLVLRWLAYLWNAEQSQNPLRDNSSRTAGGVPSAVFAETICGLSGIYLTPGMASTGSCPEAIWQAVKWWRGYFEETAVKSGDNAPAAPSAPAGVFTIRQPAAAVVERSVDGIWL